MEIIATVTWSAAAVCIVAFLGILWNHAERADQGS
jgi:hypothetical protein